MAPTWHFNLHSKLALHVYISSCISNLPFKFTFPCNFQMAFALGILRPPKQFCNTHSRSQRQFVLGIPYRQHNSAQQYWAVIRLQCEVEVTFNYNSIQIQFMSTPFKPIQPALLVGTLPFCFSESLEPVKICFSQRFGRRGNFRTPTTILCNTSYDLE